MNKFLKKYLLKTALVACTLMVSFGGKAQQDAQYTQYMYNTTSINPAYTGSINALSVAGLYRSQWLGVNGAPQTQTLNIHSPIGENGMALGVSFVNDVIGPTSETYFDTDFSYTIPLNKDGNLSFGLKASAHLLNVDFNQLNQDFGQGSDQSLQENIDNLFSPNIGAGIYYHTHTFYAGLSIPRFLETEHFNESELTTASERMNWYFIMGRVWDIHPDIKFKPAVLTKMVSGAPLQVDVSANFMFYEKFMAGLAYRWDAAMSALAGFQLSQEMFLGLAYDTNIADLGGASFNNGSFEVIVRYNFKRKNIMDAILSPRFF